MVTTPQEPAVQPDSLVQAQLSPDRRAAGPGEPTRLSLVVDNHDRRSRAVQLQLGGPMSRYCKPRISTIDLLPGEQREVAVDVVPRPTAPEGGHDYELTVTATDLTDGTFLDRSSARIAVDRKPVLRGRPTGREAVFADEPATIRFVAHNAGNVELNVEVFAVDPYFWVPETAGRRSTERTAAIRNGIDSIVGQPLATERLRPGEHWNVRAAVLPPRYLVGMGPRRWLIPVAVRAQGWSPECVFVELDQQPRYFVPYRAAVLAAAVVAAFFVLLVFMLWLAL